MISRNRLIDVCAAYVANAAVRHDAVARCKRVLHRAEIHRAQMEYRDSRRNPLWRVSGKGNGKPVTLHVRAADHDAAYQAASRKRVILIDSIVMVETQEETRRNRELAAAHFRNV